MTRKILVVDDSDDLRELLVCALAPLGEILSASSGRDALIVLAAEKPALLLLDVSMPEMSGLAVLEAARALDSKLVVVMLTGAAERGVADKALSLGANAVVMKPFEMDAVLKQLQDLLP